MLNKILRVQKGEVNQKQQLSKLHSYMSQKSLISSSGQELAS